MKKYLYPIIFLILTSNTYSNSSLDILKNDISAKVVSMAGSDAVTNKDIFSINYNPAALGFLNNSQIAINYSNGFEDSKYSYIAFGTILPYKVISDFSKPYIGLSIYATDLGDMIYRTIDDNGNITEKNLSTEKNVIITLSYGEKIHRENVFIYQGVKSNFESGIGISAKFINSKLVGYSANTIALDGGYFGSFTDIGLDFGVSISNTIGSIKYIEEKYNLPTVLRAGISYSKPTIMDQRVKTSLEFDRYITDKKSSLKLGLEYTIENTISFRTGYKFLDDNKGFSVGIGLFAGNFSVDLATVFYDIYKYSSVSIKLRFGEKEEKKEESKQLKKFLQKENKTKETLPQKPQGPSKDTIIIF
ncbi:MAG: PorV/PorQ family protein, partial [Elusimicrobiales bacterium]